MTSGKNILPDWHVEVIRKRNIDMGLRFIDEHSIIFYGGSVSKKEGFKELENVSDVIDDQSEIRFIKRLFKAVGDRAGPDVAYRPNFKKTIGLTSI